MRSPDKHLCGCDVCPVWAALARALKDGDYGSERVARAAYLDHVLASRDWIEA